jgi:hypothetical protein
MEVVKARDGCGASRVERVVVGDTIVLGDTIGKKRLSK